MKKLMSYLKNLYDQIFNPYAFIVLYIMLVFFVCLSLVIGLLGLLAKLIML